MRVAVDASLGRLPSLALTWWGHIRITDCAVILWQKTFSRGNIFLEKILGDLVVVKWLLRKCIAGQHASARRTVDLGLYSSCWTDTRRRHTRPAQLPNALCLPSPPALRLSSLLPHAP